MDKTIDIVYKLGSGSKSDDRELRYSLRSLSNFKELGKVFVVGFKPRWLQGVIHIPALDLHPANKDCNLINKLILACHHPELSERFLNMSDDQVFLKELDLSSFLVPFYDSEVVKQLQAERLSRWKRRVKNTLEALILQNLPSYCYEAHIPTLINKFDYSHTVGKFNYSDVPGMCGNTLYYNFLRVNGREFDKSYILKLEEAQTSIEKLESLCNQKTHLSYSEAATNEQLFDFLQKKFPNQSKYEIF